MPYTSAFINYLPHRQIVFKIEKALLSLAAPQLALPGCQVQVPPPWIFIPLKKRLCMYEELLVKE